MAVDHRCLASPRRAGPQREGPTFSSARGTGRRVGLLVAGLIPLALLSPAPSAAQGLDGIDVHGFVSQGYLKSDHNNYLGPTERGSYEFSEIGINFSKDLSDRLHAGMQLFSRDLGALGNHELELDWAFLDYRLNNALGLRAGHFKVPYGLYNETADIDSLRSSVLLPQGVYDLRMRDILVAVLGAGLYGNIGLGAGGDLDYELYTGTLNVAADSSLAQFFNDDGAYTVREFDVSQALGGGAVWNTPLPGLRVGATINTFEWGFSGDTSPQLVGLGLPPRVHLVSNNTQLTVYSAEYAVERWTVAFEQTRWKGEFQIDIFPDSEVNWEGWYGQVSWRANDRLQFGLYRTVRYDDASDKSGSGYSPRHLAWQKSWVASARYDVDEHWLVKLELHDIDGTQSLLLLDNPQGITEKWTLLAAKVSMIF